MNVGVISCGASNVTSVTNAIHKIGYKATLLTEPDQKTDFLILPGVGNFGTATVRLNETGFAEYIRSHVDEGKPVIGICLGMQIIFESSAESEGARGLCIHEGHFDKLQEPSSRDQSSPPNIGYNFVEFRMQQESHPLEKSFSRLNGYYYFLHSYALRKEPDTTDVLGVSSFNSEKVIPYTLKENVCGIQFHPERSGYRGLQLLTETIEFLK